MDILIYTQQGGMGGSTRLLLNLARALVQNHQVTVALGVTHTPEATGQLLKEFSDLTVVTARPEILRSRCFDVAVLHLPFNLDWSVELDTKSRIAVMMELAGQHSSVIDESNSDSFDRILYLHPEQVEHLSPQLVEQRCSQLPIINNIDFTPSYSKSRCVGTIGGAHKNSLRTIIRVIDALPEDYRLRMWSSDKLSLQGQPMELAAPAMKFIADKRLEPLPATANLEKLVQSYDALLHTPKHGNGTSVVVGDALQCGKLVLLAPLPAYRSAYGDMPGVYFTSRPLLELAEKVRQYGQRDFNQIRQAHADIYDRESVLRQWESTITGQ